VVEGISPGRLGERIAADYLRLRGWRILGRNVRAGRCEIDLIGAERGCLVFVEVKMRRGGAFGGAVEAIGTRKMSNIRKAARHYLAGGGVRFPYREIRFDLVAIDLDRGGEGMVIRHLKGIV